MGGGDFGWRPGEPTDDTELALAVLEGYRGGGLDLGPVRDAMLRWEDTDPRDVGNQTRRALRYLRDHPEAPSLPDEPEAQDNGAVMRAAPHGVTAVSPEEAALTHPSWEAKTSAALVACLVAHLVDGAAPEEALESAYALAERLEDDGRSARETFRPLEGYHHDPGGWTVYTTRLALRSLLDARGFRSGVEGVVRLAGDADTNGAVAGALLGARFGAREIPPGWSGALLARDSLLELI